MSKALEKLYNYTEELLDSNYFGNVEADKVDVLGAAIRQQTITETKREAEKELEKLNDILNSTLCKLKDIKESLLDYTIDEWSTPYINMGITIKNIEALEKSRKEKQLDSVNKQIEYPDYSSMLHLSLHLSQNHICKKL